VLKSIYRCGGEEVTQVSVPENSGKWRVGEEVTRLSVPVSFSSAGSGA